MRSFNPLCLPYLLLVIGCYGSAPPLSDAERHSIAASVDSATRSFQDAQQALELSPDTEVEQLIYLIYDYAKLGREAAGRAAGEELLRREPQVSVEAWKPGLMTTDSRNLSTDRE